jgi:hypothetical protein
MVLASEPIVETGGFCVGRNRWLAWYGSVPFGTLEIYPDRLVLDVTWRSFTFRRSAIVALSQIRLFFIPCLRILHSVSDDPRFIVFSSFYPSRVRQQLEAAGYSLYGEGPTIFG